MEDRLGRWEIAERTPPPISVVYLDLDCRLSDMLLAVLARALAEFRHRVLRRSPPMWPTLAEFLVYVQFCRKLKEPRPELDPNATEAEKHFAEDLDPFERIGNRSWVFRTSARYSSDK